MAALLSLRNVISEAEGSAMRTQIVLSAAGIGQMSVLARTGLPLTRFRLAARTLFLCGEGMFGLALGDVCGDPLVSVILHAPGLHLANEGG